MGVSNKIKALLQLRGKKNVELSEYLGFARPQALACKFKREGFSAEDLIKIAAFLECELAFIESDTQKTTLDLSDIREQSVTANDNYTIT
jgi:DNA-binding Xre family transcriptional regulator